MPEFMEGKIDQVPKRLEYIVGFHRRENKFESPKKYNRKKQDPAPEDQWINLRIDVK